MCPGVANTGQWDFLENSCLLLHPHSYCWKSLSFIPALGRPLLSCLLASFLSQHSSSPLLSHTSPETLSCFWDRKLFCFVPKPIVSLSVCWGLCGGGARSSEYLWKRGGGKRGGGVHIHAARLSFSHDLQCSVGILISSRKEAAVSNARAIPSTQRECLRQGQSLPKILILKKSTDCFRNRSLSLDLKILRSDSGSLLRKYNSELATQNCRSWQQ